MRIAIIPSFMAVALCLLISFPAVALDPLWVARFDGEVAVNDIALAMDTDSAGNVYVAGYSYGTDGDDNVRLVKFSASGQFVWTREYDGGHGWDDARDVFVEADGTVTIAGFTSNGVDWDALVIQYAADGDQNWLSTWSGTGMDDGKAVALDESGYVYVAVESDGPDLSDDIVTLRFTPEGNLDWEDRTAGTGGWNDVATDIAVSPDGVATVTGSARDASFDLVTLQYDPDGQQRWIDAYDPLGYSYELGMAVALDESGIAYVTGIELTAGGTNDMVLIKYGADGARTWVRTFDQDQNTYDEAMSVAVGTGVVAITGCSTITTNNPEIRTILYDADGNRQWAQLWGGPALRGDDCGRVALIGDNQNVVVAGTSKGVLSGDDFIALSYSTAGELLWEGRYSSEGKGDDQVTGGALTSNDSVLASGVSPDQTVDFAVVKFGIETDDDDDDDNDDNDDNDASDDDDNDDNDDNDASDDDDNDDNDDNDTMDDDDSAGDDDETGGGSDDDDSEGCGC